MTMHGRRNTRPGSGPGGSPGRPGAQEADRSGQPTIQKDLDRRIRVPIPANRRRPRFKVRLRPASAAPRALPCGSPAPGDFHATHRVRDSRRGPVRLRQRSRPHQAHHRSPPCPHATLHRRQVPASLGGTQSRGMAINPPALVAGWSNRADGHRHAAVWRDGVITDLAHARAGRAAPCRGPASTTTGWSSASRTPPAGPAARGLELRRSAGSCPRRPTSSAAGSSGRTAACASCRRSAATTASPRASTIGARSSAGPRPPVHDPTCVGRPGAPIPRGRVGAQEREQGKIKTRELRPYRRRRRLGRHGDQRPGRGGRHLGRLRPGRRAGSARATPCSGTRTTSRWRSPTSAARPGTRRWTSTPRATSSASPTRRGRAIPRASSSRRRSSGSSGAPTATRPRNAGRRPLSEAFAINAHASGGGRVLRRDGRARGRSSGGTACCTNLNDLVDVAPDVLLSAQDINDDGQITGRVRDGVTGKVMTFVATPR